MKDNPKIGRYVCEEVTLFEDVRNPRATMKICPSAQPNMLLVYNKDILYRKVGYILSCFKEEFRLSDEFFEFCKQKSDMGKGCLYDLQSILILYLQ